MAIRIDGKTGAGDSAPPAKKFTLAFDGVVAGWDGAAEMTVGAAYKEMERVLKKEEMEKSLRPMSLPHYDPIAADNRRRERDQRAAVETAGLAERERLRVRDEYEANKAATAGAAQAPVPAATPATATTQTTKHRDQLAPLVDAAQKASASANDAAAVFTILKTWAQKDSPRPPLAGVTEDGRIQWRDSNDSPKELTKKALTSRLKRQQERPATTPPGKQLRRIK